MKHIPETILEALSLHGFQIRKLDDPDTGEFFVLEMMSISDRSEKACIQKLVSQLHAVIEQMAPFEDK